MTLKEKQFCKYYILDFNATNAAKIAGYSKKSARNQGANLCAKVCIQTEIAKQIEKRNERINVSQDQVIHELKRIAFSDIKSVLNKNGEIDFTKIDDSVSPIISEYKEHIRVGHSKTGEWDDTKKTIKLHDKMKAIESLGRHLGMFNDKLDVNEKMTIELVDPPVFPGAKRKKNIVRKSRVKKK